MRKMITMAVTAALAISTLTACGKTDKKETTASTAATTASTAATTASTEAKTEAKDTSAAAAESKADAQTPVSGSVATDGSTSMEKVVRHLQRQIQMLPLLTTQLVLVLESLLYLRDAAISVFPAVH